MVNVCSPFTAFCGPCKQAPHASLLASVEIVKSTTLVTGVTPHVLAVPGCNFCQKRVGAVFEAADNLTFVDQRQPGD